MKYKLKRMMALCSAAALGASLLTAPPVFAEAENNEFVKVDFEEEIPEGFISSDIAEDPDDANNHVWVFENTRDSEYDLKKPIKPAKVMSELSERTGKLTYEFKIKFPSDNSMTEDGAYYAVDTRLEKYNGPVTGSLSADSVVGADGKTKLAIDENKRGDWYNIQQVFDYSTLTYDLYCNGKEVLKNTAFTLEYDPFDALFLRGNVPAGFKCYIDDLAVSYIEEVPQMVEGISVFDGDEYMELEGFDYENTTYEAEVYGDFFVSMDTVEEPVHITFAEGYEDAEIDYSFGAASNGKRSLFVTVTQFPFSATYEISCSSKPRPYYAGSISEDFTGKSASDLTDWVKTPAAGKVINEGDEHGEVYNYEAAGVGNYSIKIDAQALKDVCEHTGVLTYSFDYKINDKYQTLESGETSPYAVKLGGAITVAYMRWDNVTVYENNVTKKFNDSSDPADYCWGRFKMVVDTNTKQVKSYINDELIYTATKSTMTVDQAFNIVIQWWSNDKCLSDVYIDNVEVNYVASHPEMVSDITLLGNEIPGFEQKTYEYDLDIFEDEYEELSEDSIEIALFDEFADNAEVTKKIEAIDGIKRISVTLSGEPWACTYVFNCTSVMRPAGMTISEFGIKDYDITYKGSLNDNLGRPLERDFTVLVYEKGTQPISSETKFAGLAKSDGEGVIDDTITIYDDESASRVYPIEMLINPYGIDEPQTFDMLFVNQKKFNENVDALKASDKTVMEFIMTDDGNYNTEIFEKLGVWVDKYEEFTTEQAKADSMATKLKSEITTENIDEIVDGAIITSYANKEKPSTDVLLSLIEKYDTEVKGIIINDVNFTSIDKTDKTWIINNVIANVPKEGFADWEKCERAIRTSAVLNSVNNTVYTKLEKMLLDNEELFGENKLANLKAETNSEVKDAAMKSMIARVKTDKYDSVTELISTLNSALEAAKETAGSTPSNGITSGGGGGSSLGGGSVSMGAANVGTNTQTNTQTNPQPVPEKGDMAFNDLNNHGWAKASIENLYEKGIISGVGDKTFEPARTITREEFVKLICQAFNLEKADAESRFDDVKSDSWYGEYVMTAVENGIVNGISDSLFGTGMNITREDMAVMIYRALQKSGKTFTDNASDFADESEFAEYSAEAIKALAASGIVSGMGDNNFAPKSYATRAESAVMIDRCINNFEIK